MPIKKKRIWDFLIKEDRHTPSASVVAIPGEDVFCGKINGAVCKRKLSKIVFSVEDVSRDLDFRQAVRYSTNSDKGVTEWWDDHEVGNEVGKLIRRLNGEDVLDHRYKISTSVSPGSEVYQIEHSKIISRKVLGVTLRIDGNKSNAKELLYVCFNFTTNDYRHLNIDSVFLSKEDAFNSLELSIKG